MIITVLWEDSREGITKGFGAHELLVTCVAEKLGRKRYEVGRQISSLPKNGAGNVVKALKRDLAKLTKTGPVFAVIDWDKARKLCKPNSPPANCKPAIRETIKNDLPSKECEIVFLVQNMESLLYACDESASTKAGGRKPSPDLRDRVLGKAASEAPVLPRATILSDCPSFARLVDRVSAALSC